MISWFCEGGQRDTHRVIAGNKVFIKTVKSQEALQLPEAVCLRTMDDGMDPLMIHSYISRRDGETEEGGVVLMDSTLLQLANQLVLK